MMRGAYVPEEPMVLKMENERWKTAVEEMLNHIGKRGECKKCHRVVWWVRDLHGRLIPYTSRATNHLMDCPFAKLK